MSPLQSSMSQLNRYKADYIYSPLGKKAESLFFIQAMVDFDTRGSQLVESTTCLWSDTQTVHLQSLSALRHLKDTTNIDRSKRLTQNLLHATSFRTIVLAKKHQRSVSFSNQQNRFADYMATVNYVWSLALVQWLCQDLSGFVALPRWVAKVVGRVKKELPQVGSCIGCCDLALHFEDKYHSWLRPTTYDWICYLPSWLQALEITGCLEL